jgi:hypothetical protein
MRTNREAEEHHRDGFGGIVQSDWIALLRAAFAEGAPPISDCKNLFWPDKPDLFYGTTFKAVRTLLADCPLKRSVPPPQFTTIVVGAVNVATAWSAITP